MKRIFLFAVFTSFAVSCFSQTRVDDLLRKIDFKMKYDKPYLDIYSVTLRPDNFKDADYQVIYSVRGDTFDLASAGGGVEYKFGFLRENVASDSMVLLYIDRYTTSGGGSDSVMSEGLSGGTGATQQTIIERIFFFKDFYYFKKKETTRYLKMYQFLADYIYNKEYDYLKTLDRGIENSTMKKSGEPKAEREIKPGDAIVRKEGHSSRNNDDFLNFHRVLNNHKYPVHGFGAGSSSIGRGGASGGPEWNMDISFHTISVSHEKLQFGPGRSSFHFSTADRNLNLLPYQSMHMNAGLRFLVSTDGDDQFKNIREQTLIDAKILGRIGMDLKNVASGLPFVMAENPTVNLGNGFTIDLLVTRPFKNAPFLGFYISTGSVDVNSPKTFLGRMDDTSFAHAYFSFTQWEGFFSFYWNANSDQEGRFRLDIGAGTYDIIKAEYYGSQLLRTKNIHDKISPFIALYYNYVILVTEKKTYSEKFGVWAKFFDSRPNIGLWFKLMEFPKDNPMHMIRLETNIITDPVFRSLHEWENSGGVMFSLRYRYAFPIQPPIGSLLPTNTND